MSVVEDFLERDAYEYDVLSCPLCDYKTESDTPRVREEIVNYDLGKHFRGHMKIERRVKRVMVKIIDKPVVEAV